MVFDNTGDTSGCSDDLNIRGRNIKNTKNGDIDIDTSSTNLYNTYTNKTRGIWDIYYIVEISLRFPQEANTFNKLFVYGLLKK